MEQVLDRPENAQASNISGMPRHKDGQLPLGAGIVLPEQRSLDWPQPLSRL